MNEIKQCEEGDKFYKISKDGVKLIQIVEITHHSLGHYSYKDNFRQTYFSRSFDSTLFKTEDECKRALRQKNLIKEKRKKLKEYEEKLNQEFGIVNHYIVK